MNPTTTPLFRVVRVSIRETQVVELTVPSTVSDETARKLVQARWNGFRFDPFKHRPGSSGGAVILSSDTVERDALLETPVDPNGPQIDYPQAVLTFWSLTKEMNL